MGEERKKKKMKKKLRKKKRPRKQLKKPEKKKRLKRLNRKPKKNRKQKKQPRRPRKKKKLQKKPRKKRRQKKQLTKPKKNRKQKKLQQKLKRRKRQKRQQRKQKKKRRKKRLRRNFRKKKRSRKKLREPKKARDADQLRTLFQQIDLDGNGVLNFEEFQRAFQAAGGLGDISTAKEVLETAKAKKQAEDDEEANARAEREKVKDHFPERKRSQKEEEKVVIKPANLSSRGKRVQEEDITMEEEDMSYQEQGDKFVEDKDSKVQDVVRHLLQEVKITINLKTLKHHIDHIFMIRLGTMLKAGTLTFDKYVRIKNQDRRRIKELIGHTTAQEYNEGEDVFASLDKALKLSGVRTKSEDDAAIGEQVALLLKQTRVPVSQKDFIYHMNKIITIILGMM